MLPLEMENARNNSLEKINDIMIFTARLDMAVAWI